MQTQSNTRKQVMAEIIGIARQAKAEGRDGIAAIVTAFPGIPLSVAAEAWWDAEEESTESWWQSVEKTIDAEVIRTALVKAGH